MVQTTTTHVCVLLSQAVPPQAYHSALHSFVHYPFWQVHCIGNGNHNQFGLSVSGPVKEVIHDGLFSRPQQIQLRREVSSYRSPALTTRFPYLIDDEQHSSLSRIGRVKPFEQKILSVIGSGFFTSQLLNEI